MQRVWNLMFTFIGAIRNLQHIFSQKSYVLIAAIYSSYFDIINSFIMEVLKSQSWRNQSTDLQSIALQINGLVSIW